MQALAGAAAENLDECLSSGMLSADAEGVAFRHELVRFAVEESLPPHRAVGLHRAAVAALGDPPRGTVDLARLAHHAEAAVDVEAVLRFAPAAAAWAASVGAHSAAAAQYARALRFAAALAPDERAQLYERRAFECWLTAEDEEAELAIRQAIALYHELGDRLREGSALQLLAFVYTNVGRTPDYAGAAQQAVSVLEQLPPGPELGMAYTTVATGAFLSEDREQTLAWAGQALELAERFDNKPLYAMALSSIGGIDAMRGSAEGRRMVERCFAYATEHGLEEQIGGPTWGCAWRPNGSARSTRWSVPSTRDSTTATNTTLHCGDGSSWRCAAGSSSREATGTKPARHRRWSSSTVARRPRWLRTWCSVC
jgi:tetratricopeptide (TPR) repeat protein